MARRRSRSKLSGAAADLVARERVCRVATTNADGQPHLVPVCHVLATGKLYIGSGDDGPKVRNLKANPKIAVTVSARSASSTRSTRSTRRKPPWPRPTR
jgi:nitroimidazol reductase NimA-like FMN-containing flavoprotein (pyridoxamine 5'-phosphate oxidase superfamily)